MRALAVFPNRREIRLIDRPEPRETGPRQVAIRVREVGICGTDREIASFQYGAPPAGTDHFILGHEALAEVETVGDGVEHLHPGQLVVPLVRLPCTKAGCQPCRAGRQDFCVTGRYSERGIKEADGFLVEKTLAGEEDLVPVPAALAEVAVLVEPITIAAKAFVQIRRFEDRLPWDPLYPRALVLGAGPVGLIAAMAAMANSYETCVYSLEPSGGDRARFVEGFGAQYVSSLDVPQPSGLARTSGPFHLVVEATGHSPLAFAALEALGPNGTCVFTGVPAGGPPTPIDTDRLMKDIVLKNQLLFGTVNAGREDYAEAIRMLEQFMGLFPDSVRGLITSRTPLEEAPALLSHGRDIKSVVTIASTRN